MAYIYKITNDINQKIYIGKTERDIKTRWKEHCNNSRKPQLENRPLYRAMQKYGIEHFSIIEIEECDNAEEREKYWIEFYGSFKNGYNATIGGDGKPYIDYDLVVATYREVKNQVEVAKLLGIYEDTVGDILKAKKEKIYTSQEVNLHKLGNVINQYTKQGEYIKSFASAAEAAREVVSAQKGKNAGVSHITDVCKGKRKTAYGYIWKYADE